MKFLHKIKKEIKLSVMVILAFSMIAFVENKQGEKLCHEISIMVYDNGTNYFLDKEEVHQLVTDHNNEVLIGTLYDKIDLKSIEKRIRSNKYVADAQAYTNLRGQVIVDVRLNIPVARFMHNGNNDFYICESGKIMPTSEKYTSRVLLLSGDFLNHMPGENIRYDSTYQKIFDLIMYIHDDEFWKAQIAQIDIDRAGYITLFPQVTKQYIEFGKPVSIEEKFLKLKVFYKKILPYKGWNHYTRVNIEFKDQIVCE
ncbi:MAG: cell division protein FtsQ [Cyclobacteriaceae bacterium]|nr:cell division protein FtsQ [Cyclobacteriaceae bacterium]